MAVADDLSFDIAAGEVFGLPLGPVRSEKALDVFSIVLAALGLAGQTLALRLNPGTPTEG